MLSGQAPFQGNCGQSCDWDKGGSCRDCQSLLWHSILDADYSFDNKSWTNVSTEAKDLISNLLVKEAPKRYTIDSVLQHSWLEMVRVKFLKHWYLMLIQTKMTLHQNIPNIIPYCLTLIWTHFVSNIWKHPLFQRKSIKFIWSAKCAIQIWTVVPSCSVAFLMHKSALFCSLVP